MNIRRFKDRGWNQKIIDYIEYDGKETYRINPKCERIISDDATWSLSHCERDAEELPCYAKDLIEGDIAVINYSGEIEIVFIHSQRSEDNNCMVSLTKKHGYWTDISDNKCEVLALLGNSFDNKRVTYGVKRYG